MVTRDDYKEPEVQACHSVLLELMTLLSEFRDNIVIVGGNVPPLLIPSPEKTHVGTIDVDLALDHHRISNDTYQKIVKTLTSRGYYQKPAEDPFVFYRNIDIGGGRTITVEVDLLSGEYGGTGAGHRHQKIQDAQARKARGCDLVFDNAITVNIAGTLPDGARNEVTVKIPSIGPFLVMKGMAIASRQKEKDAYDIYYCCRYYQGGLNAIIEATRPLVSNRLVQEGLGKIRSKFSTIDSIGATWAANFEVASSAEEKARIKREAFELINRLLDDLNIGRFEG